MNSKQRISEREREVAIHELEGFFERGFIDREELDARRNGVSTAMTADDIEPFLADLRAGRRGRRERRVTEDERQAARRRLRIHSEEGQLTEAEWLRRDDLVKAASTHAEVAQALAELPGLKPARERREDRLASNAERQIAIERLDAAYKEGRIELEEYEQRAEVVSAARTRAEIQSAFRGLPLHRLGAPHMDIKTVKHAAEGAKREVVRGWFVLARAFVIIGWVSVCALIALVWIISGMAPAIPIALIALVSLVSVVLLWAPGLSPRRR